MRRRKPSAAGPERPIDTPSLAYNHMRFIAGDFIDFKESVKRPWRKGQVKELGHHCLVIEPADGSALVTIYPGKCGRVRQRHGGAAAQMPAYLDPEGQAQAASRLEADGVFARLEIDGIFVRPRPSEGEAEPGYGLPLVEPVCKDGSRLRAVPKPPPPTRDPEYIIFVQQYPCCSCAAEAPSEAHHQGRHGMGIKCSDYRCVPLCHLCHTTFTATGALPRRDRAASLARMQEMQVELLTRWAELVAQRADVEAARVVLVPFLRLVAAAGLLVLLGLPGRTALAHSARGYASSSTTSSTTKTTQVSLASSSAGDGFPSSRALVSTKLIVSAYQEFGTVAGEVAHG